MDKSMTLQWLLADATEQGDHILAPAAGRSLEDLMAGVVIRGTPTLPQDLPRHPREMMEVLRQHLRDDVTLISLVLNHHFPERFLFY